MKHEIDLTSYSGVILIPDASTKISSQDYAVAVPSVAVESSGSYIQKRAHILKYDFATHIHDLASESISIAVKKDSGTSEFSINATKLGESYEGMSPWWLLTSNGWTCNLAEAVIEKPSDLNQCIEALAIKAGGGDFRSGTKERAIIKSIDTIQCSKKD
jgi:hypothetical protein